MIDGRPNDAVWAAAPQLDGFRQFAPAEDGEATFRTEVQVAYDDRRLYRTKRLEASAEDCGGTRPQVRDHAQLRTSARDPVSTTILGAGKVTGRLGNGLSLGLVEAVTRREAGVNGQTIEPRTSYLVARAVKELRQGRSSIGTMITSVNRDLDAGTEPLVRRDALSVLAQGFHRFASESWEFVGYTGRAFARGSAQAMARS